MNSQKSKINFDLPIEADGNFYFNDKLSIAHFSVEWLSVLGLFGKLSLNIYCYDERARFIQKLDEDAWISNDGSCELFSNIDINSNHSNINENVIINLSNVEAETTAMLLFLDGGTRGFQFIQNFTFFCLARISENKEESYLPTFDRTYLDQFQISFESRKDCQGYCLGVLYKDGWHESTDTSKWILKVLMEPVHVNSLKEKENICSELLVNSVPSLERFRKRIFSNVSDICNALSSHTLPKLKKKFQSVKDKVHLIYFTDFIFSQLYESDNRISDTSEAAITISLLEEMFYQIDFDGDDIINWDQFTTFCIQASLSGGSTEGSKDAALVNGKVTKKN